MAEPLLCDERKNWVIVAQKVSSSNFPVLLVDINGLAITHTWLRKREYELHMHELTRQHDPGLLQSYQSTWGYLLYDGWNFNRYSTSLCIGLRPYLKWFRLSGTDGAWREGQNTKRS
jgi:hypothetical protein